MNTGAQKSTPVTVTRGSKHPPFPQSGVFASQQIDWIEGTFKGRQPVNLPPILTGEYVECKAFNGYTVGSLYADGRTLFQNPLRPEMGTHLTWSGDACRQCPVTPLELVKHLLVAQFSFTRLDFAIDIINGNLDPAQATEELKNGRYQTRAKEFPYWSNAQGVGYTQYIGKKTSEVYCRIYDKAAEMGIQQDHTRVELVVKHKRADAAARSIVQHRDFRGLVVSFITFQSWREWDIAMATAPIDLPSERKATNTEKWLLDAVAPALARVIFLNPHGVAFYEKFKDEVMQRLQELSNRQTVH